MEKHDAIILGGGLVGLTLALSLDAHGVRVAVVDPADPAATIAPSFDGRASAIASASWKLLQAIGVGARLEGAGCPIYKIRVSDGLAPESLDFAPAPEDGPLGIMFENRLLRIALAESADASTVSRHQPARPVGVDRGEAGVTVTLDNGGTLSAPLLIAAEGRNSPTREAAGIRVARWSYDHVAMIAAVEHERDHGNIAHEIFYPAGPFALLPMTDSVSGAHRSAIVWTVAAKDAPAMLGLGDRAWATEIGKRMGGMLGALTPVGHRGYYPLGFHHAATITGRRLALVGDAAHGIHPIAGQGLNLGFRDVAALTQAIVEGMRLGLDPGDSALLARYERWRGLDTLMVAAATDGLTRLFGIPGRAASRIRRLGMRAVARAPMLKSRFMAEARGESGALPTLLTGERI